MATKVRLKKGQELVKARSGGGAAKYDWDAWFDGDIWRIERSEGSQNDKGTIEVPTVTRDYGVPTNAMPPKIQTAARRRYKVAEVFRNDTDGNRLKDALLIRARDMDDDERMAEDLLRAEEAEAAKARRRAGAVSPAASVASAADDGAPQADGDNAG